MVVSSQVVARQALLEARDDLEALRTQANIAVNRPDPLSVSSSFEESPIPPAVEFRSMETPVTSVPVSENASMIEP